MNEDLAKKDLNSERYDSFLAGLERCKKILNLCQVDADGLWREDENIDTFEFIFCFLCLFSYLCFFMIFIGLFI